MRAECVVPEAQCAIKRSNKKPTPKSIASSPAVPGGPGGGGGGGSAPAADYRLKLARPLKPEEEELINQVYKWYVVHRLGYYVRYRTWTGYRTGTKERTGTGYRTVTGYPTGTRYCTGPGYRTGDQILFHQRKFFFTKVVTKCIFSRVFRRVWKVKYVVWMYPPRPTFEIFTLTILTENDAKCYN